MLVFILLSRQFLTDRHAPLLHPKFIILVGNEIHRLRRTLGLWRACFNLKASVFHSLKRYVNFDSILYRVLVPGLRKGMMENYLLLHPFCYPYVQFLISVIQGNASLVLLFSNQNDRCHQSPLLIRRVMYHMKPFIENRRIHIFIRV